MNSIHTMICMESKVLKNYLIQQRFRPMPMKVYRGFYVSKFTHGLKDMIVILVSNLLNYDSKQWEESVCDRFYIFLYSQSPLQNMINPSKNI